MKIGVRLSVSQKIVSNFDESYQAPGSESTGTEGPRGKVQGARLKRGKNKVSTKAWKKVQEKYLGAFSNSLKLADQFERPPVATGKGLVEFGPRYLGLLHLRGDITDDFSGNTDHEFSRGNFPVIGDHTP